jgi:hypothetical protein
MRHRNISAEFIKGVYTQLFTNADNTTKEGFDYYNGKVGFSCDFDIVSCWTSRYLLFYYFESTDPAFHDITVFDVFNDKSM